MKSKRIAAMVLAALLCVGFTGCEMMAEILEVVEKHADPDASFPEEEAAKQDDAEDRGETGFGVGGNETQPEQEQQTPGRNRPQRAEDVVITDISIVPPEGFQRVAEAESLLGDEVVFAYSPNGSINDSTFIYMLTEDWQEFDKEEFFESIEDSMDEYSEFAENFHYDKRDTTLDGWPAYYYEIMFVYEGEYYAVAEVGVVLDKTYVLFFMDETGDEGYLAQFKRFVEDFEFVYG